MGRLPEGFPTPNEWLARIAEERGISRRGLARMIGVEPTQVQRWISGRELIPRHHLAEIAKQIGLPREEGYVLRLKDCDDFAGWLSKQATELANYVGEMTGEQIERAILQRVEDLLSQEAGLERNDRVEMLAIHLLDASSAIRSLLQSAMLDCNHPLFSPNKADVIDLTIKAIPFRVGSLKPIVFYSCFISYSNNDRAFAEQLYTNLQRHGILCWFGPEDLKIGDHYHQRIDESIRVYDKVILILSEHAIRSAWVEREVVAAREKEDREQRQVLFPLRLDEAVMGTTMAWAADIRRRWHIGDFTCWKAPDAYQVAFQRLLRDLRAEYHANE